MAVDPTGEHQEEHLLPYWGEQQQVRKGKDGLKNWT